MAGNYNLGATATTVAVVPSLTGTQQATMRFINTGSQPVYLGGVNVGPTSGFKLMPGQRLETPVANSTYYACSGAQVGATNTTVTTSATAGTTTFTVGSTTGFLAGTTLVVGNTTVGAPEYLVVASTASATVFTASTASLFDHMAGATVATATLQIGQLNAQPGVH